MTAILVPLRAGPSNLTDITGRMAMATKAGVLHVDFWASAKQPDWAFGPEWWAAIRKWKGGAPIKMDDSAATAAVPLLLQGPHRR